MKKSKHPVILIGGALLLGMILILLSLFSNRVRWDRETAVSAAKYDGEALIKQLSVLPAVSISFREVESGPLAPDLSNVREAWIAWKETFSSQTSFPDLASSYRQNLGKLGWTTIESTDRNVASFQNGEWTLTLTLLSMDAKAQPIRFRRLIEWRTIVP